VLELQVALIGANVLVQDNFPGRRPLPVS